MPVLGTKVAEQPSLAATTAVKSQNKTEPTPESMEPRSTNATNTTTAVTTIKPAVSTGTSQIHVVTSGESLYTISRRYGARIADLRNWNNLPYDRENIRIGDSLIVAVSSSAAPTTTRVERISITRAVPHKVVSGESLASIATLYGTTPDKIASLNSIKKNASLKAGKTLQVETSLSKSELASIQRAAPTGKPLSIKCVRANH